MISGWRYRIASVAGVCCITAVAVTVANHPLAQRGATMVPVFDRLPAITMTNGELTIAALTTLVIVLGTFVPLFKPRPRRRLDMLLAAESRVLVTVFALATVGYFDYTYRLPRTTLVLSAVLLGVLLPPWFVLIRRQSSTDPRRAVIVGDDPDTIEDVLDATEMPIIGYVSPPPRMAGEIRGSGPRVGTPDGGQLIEQAIDDLECLGGLSRLDEVLVKHDVDAAVLAFSRPDRAEFFGTLDTLYDHGVTAKVHRDHADTVLTRDEAVGDLVDVDIEPWDWQDYAAKRLFDVVFAASGLLLLGPLMALIAVAIKLDSDGPVLYSQQRTAEFGDTFVVHKFRTMLPDSDDPAPVDDDENDRITRVGRGLRSTHLDELPQLWAILVGRMSVVGPRATWTQEETHLERTSDSWRKRWFVKPGLTGLAQINDVTSTQPAEKLRYDVTYIRNQSFWFDLKILFRQLWKVALDCVRVVR